MIQYTTLINATLNILNNISTTVLPLTTGNYSNNTNHDNTNNDDKNDFTPYIIIIIILAFIVCSLLEGFHRAVTSDNEPFIVKIIKFPFIFIISLPNIIIMIIIYPFGEETKNKYKIWRKNLKEYWYYTCLDIVDCIFNIEREETLPYVVQDVTNTEVNQFFSAEYETIEYPKEEIDVCSICMEKLDINCETKNEKLVLLTCGHCFHEECLKSWYRSSIQKDCPICRKTLKIKNYYVFEEI